MASSAEDRLGILKIHLPLDRSSTQTRRAQCINTIKDRVHLFRDVYTTSALMTDHNTHGPMPHWGGHGLYQHGFDYIGCASSRRGATLKVLKRKKIEGHIDNHDYIGVKVQITWPSGRKTKTWLVQANLGRGVSSAVFEKDCRRIKRVFRGNFILGFDEVDEADSPEEHSIMEKVWNPKRCTFAGWKTLSPVIVSSRIPVERVEIIKACEGLAHVTPHRDLVEVVVLPPKRLITKIRRH